MRRAKTRLLSLLPVPVLAFSASPIGSLPTATAGTLAVAPPTAMVAAIESAPVCIGSSISSAGDLGDTLYYRASALSDGTIAVGYFAFWSEERPWGDNWMTYTVIPALAVDLVYSRALTVAPGLQRALYGKGDVEGVRVVYRVAGDGKLVPERALANNGVHEPVAISKNEMLALDPSRPVFYSDVWSHQLGGKGAVRASDLKYMRCYDRDHVRPLTAAIADEYGIDAHQRAKPAHVEAL